MSKVSCVSSGECLGTAFPKGMLRSANGAG